MKERNLNTLTVADIAYMMDPSILKLNTSYEDLDKLIAACKKYEFGCAFAWPGYYPELSAALKGTKTAFGTSLAFPSGQEATITKVHQAEYFMTFEPAEVDMVMNVGWLVSKRYKEATEDIAAVKKAIGKTSLKVIIEAMLLDDEQIKDACKVVMDSGADYVKSGTGFSAAPTTLHHVALIKDTIGDNIKFKVAGGVRSLDTMLKMYKLGARRFGIGLPSAINIIEDALKLPGCKITMDEIHVDMDAAPDQGGY